MGYFIARRGMNRTNILLLFIAAGLFYIYMNDIDFFITYTPSSKVKNDPVIAEYNDFNDFMRSRALNPPALVHLVNKEKSQDKRNIDGHLQDQHDPIKLPKILSTNSKDDPIGPDMPSANEARDHVKLMMQHAWNSYSDNAWGNNEVKPITGAIDNSLYRGASLGATIIDSLDTLIIMGMTDEYRKAREWVAHDMRFDHDIVVSAFETTIRILGGLLSAYGLTHDPIYITKAKDIGDRLFHQFNNIEIPVNGVNLLTGSLSGSHYYSTAEIGTLQMEYEYLSDITGDEKYRKAVIRLRDLMWEKAPDNYMVEKEFDGEQYHGGVTLGAMEDSYFEYLLKAWLLGGQKDDKQWLMYEKISNALVENLWVDNKKTGGYNYFADSYKTKTFDHLACFAGGMYTLGSHYHRNFTVRSRDFSVGEDLTETCFASYDITPSKIGPEAIKFDDDGHIIRGKDRRYILRPETIESYYYLWRFTHNQKYRQWGWQALMAIEKHCKTKHGYAVLRDVYSATPMKEDEGMPSFFLAETLKYLYLLFSDDDAMPLDDYVFNTEAHPFPVMGKRSNTYQGKVFI